MLYAIVEGDNELCYLKEEAERILASIDAITPRGMDSNSILDCCLESVISFSSHNILRISVWVCECYSYYLCSMFCSLSIITPPSQPLQRSSSNVPRQSTPFLQMGEIDIFTSLFLFWSLKHFVHKLLQFWDWLFIQPCN